MSLACRSPAASTARWALSSEVSGLAFGSDFVAGIGLLLLVGDFVLNIALPGGRTQEDRPGEPSFAYDLADCPVREASL